MHGSRFLMFSSDKSVRSHGCYGPSFGDASWLLGRSLELQPYTCHLNGLDDFARKLLWFNPDSCVVVIWDIITWIIDQSLACQGQVQQFKNRKETDTSTMCSTGRVANLHRFKNPCGVKMSHAQIDCSTRNQRLCLTSISQEIYGATCKF